MHVSVCVCVVLGWVCVRDGVMSVCLGGICECVSVWGVHEGPSHVSVCVTCAHLCA